MKITIITLFTMAILQVSCAQETKSQTLNKREIIQEVTGDLDKDGISEKVIVFETNRKQELGTERDLEIYKMEDGQWKLWFQSSKAIMKSLEGGTLGDPFQGIAIKNGLLLIEHYGGSNLRWSYTHKYRFQNKIFSLIGVTTQNSSGEDNEIFDYNLLNGKAIYSVYTDGVLDKRETCNHKMKDLPKLSTIRFGQYKIMIPKAKTYCYF